MNMHRLVAVLCFFTLFMSNMILSSEPQRSTKSGKSKQKIVPHVAHAPVDAPHQQESNSKEPDPEQKADDSGKSEVPEVRSISISGTPPAMLALASLSRRGSGGSDSLGDLERPASPTPSSASQGQLIRKKAQKQKAGSQNNPLGQDSEQKVHYSEAARLEKGWLSGVWSFIEGNVRETRTIVFSQIQNGTFLEKNPIEHQRSYRIDTALAEFIVTRKNRPHDGLLCRALATIRFAHEHNIQISEKNVQEVCLMLQARMQKDADHLKLLQRLIRSKKPSSKKPTPKAIVHREQEIEEDSEPEDVADEF